MATTFLENKNCSYALSLKGAKLYPSAVIGAEFSRVKVVAKSGPISPSDLVVSLSRRLQRLGPLYSVINGNSVGCCAEVNSANKILEKRPYVELKKIKFSKALRPRTMQIIPTCKNCKQTFQ